MAYERPRFSARLTKPEKVDLLSDYLTSYRAVAASDPKSPELNIKLDRAAFSGLLDEIGALLIERDWRRAGKGAEALD